MKELNIGTWREYNLCGEDGLFECMGSKTTPKVELEQRGSGVYPYVTTQATGNGIAGFYDVYTEFGNVLTIDSAVLGTCFYQKDKFSASDHVEILKPKFDMTKYIALFLVTILNKNAQILGYAYNLKRSQEALKQETIILPSRMKENENFEPDWQYMEEYMKEIENKVKFSSVQFNLLSKSNKDCINSHKWKFFHLYDLFDIDMGSKLDKINMKEDKPSIDFVGRASVNQGVTAKVNRIDDLTPYKSGCLTLALGGEYLGSCFIQKNDFYTSQNVIVLIPKMSMSFGIKQFIATSIFIESQLHYKAFIDELNPHIKTDFQFKLPVDENNIPDWQYMEEYMKEITSKSEKSIQVLKTLVC